jgi:hypothetical protein
MRRGLPFHRPFEARCGIDERPWEDVTRCGLELRDAYGFPDDKCGSETPLADAERRLKLEDARQARIEAEAQAEPLATAADAATQALPARAAAAR